jgi:PhnB protein
MAKAVKPIPDGYHSVTPYISVKGGVAALELYQRAFGAAVVFKMEAPGGRIAHAEIRIGDCHIMLADESDMADAVLKSPRSLGGASAGLHVYVADVDAQFARAFDAGATIKRAVANQFYGDRSGTLEDPFGHIWTLATHVEDLSPEAIKQRAQAQGG